MKSLDISITRYTDIFCETRFACKVCILEKGSFLGAIEEN